MPTPRPAIPILPEGYALVDTHCHLDMDEYRSDLQEVIARAAAHGVTGIVTIGIDLPSSQRAVAIARRFPAVRATIGIHPHHAAEVGDDDLTALADLAEQHRDVVVAFGEIGLDYAKQYAAPDRQRDLFSRQLDLAAELRLPVVIHNREAHDDCLRLLRAHGRLQQGGVMHCFSGDLALARTVIELNLDISIPGIVTFKNANDLHRVAADLPLERMLIETDGPFLAPAPYRGKRNEPLFTLYTAAAIASLRRLELAEIAAATSRNAARLFNSDFSTGRG